MDGKISVQAWRKFFSIIYVIFIIRGFFLISRTIRAYCTSIGIEMRGCEIQIQSGAHTMTIVVDMVTNIITVATIVDGGGCMCGIVTRRALILHLDRTITGENAE